MLRPRGQKQYDVFIFVKRVQCAWNEGAVSASEMETSLGGPLGSEKKHKPARSQGAVFNRC